MLFRFDKSLFQPAVEEVFPQEVYQSGNIVRHVPGVLPAVAFYESLIGEHIEIRVPVTQAVTPHDELFLRVEYVLIIHRTCQQRFSFFFLSERQGQLGDAPVVVRIIECFGNHSLFHRHITLFDINVQQRVAAAASAGMVDTCFRDVFQHGFIDCFTDFFSAVICNNHRLLHRLCVCLFDRRQPSGLFRANLP